MLTFAATVAIIGSSATMAQTDPASAQAPIATAQTMKVHTHRITRHDGKRRPKITKVVHRSTVATPTGPATRTTTATTTTAPPQ